MHSATMKKGLLIFPILKDLSKADGIVVKNEGIYKGFINNNVPVDAVEFNTRGIYGGGEQIYSFHPKRYLRILQYNFVGWKRIAAYFGKNNYDFVWFRIPVMTPPVAAFVRSLRRKKPGCKIILEYGAYPYVNEMSGLKKKIYQLNRGNEKSIHKIVDFVITYSGQKEVDGVTNIPINNGIDLTKIPVIHHEKSDLDTLNFISVSSLKKWHAYERFIAGMPAYLASQPATPIHFNIIGDGPEYEKLVKLTKELKLEKFITFHNFKTGKELDAIYKLNHVAVSTLGFHRLGLTNSSSLKNREYFARGLPIILSTTDMDMPADLPFVKYVPGGEEPLDLAPIVAFAKSVYDRDNVNEEIRSYAEEHVSWDSKIKTVLSCLNT